MSAETTTLPVRSAAPFLISSIDRDRGSELCHSLVVLTRKELIPPEVHVDDWIEQIESERLTALGKGLFDSSGRDQHVGIPVMCLSGPGIRARIS